MDDKPKMTVPMMMQKLDDMYIKEKEIIIQMRKLKLEYEQLQEDKDLLQTMIIHQSNKTYRFG